MKKLNVKSISFKLMVGGCLLTLVPLIVIGWVAITKSTNALLHVGHDNLKEQAYEIASIVETNLELQAEMAGLFATGEHIIKVLEKVKNEGIDKSKEDIASLRIELKNGFKALDEHFLGIFVTDTNGLLLTGELESGKEYKGSNISSRGYFKEAIKTKHAAVGEIVKSKSTGKLIYVVCAPVFSSGKEFLGVFGMSIKSHFLVEEVSGIKHGETGYGWMVNKDGIFISHPDEKNLLTLDLKTLSGMEDITKSMLGGEKGVEDYIFKGVHKIAGFAPVPIKGWSVALTQNEEEFLQAPHEIRNYIILIALLTMLLVVVLIFFAARAITNPIDNAATGLKDIAEGEGDLTTRLQVTTKDEVGKLSESFNAFIEKLHQMITDISQGVETLSSSSTEMASIAEDMSNSSDQTSEKANTVAAASEEMTANMNSVAASMEQSSVNINTVVSAAEEMNSTINEIAQNAESARAITLNAVSMANESTEIMNGLSDAAKAIGNVVETITDISAQVNLLSLNATIEAARAGEAGKGFAVVANEIKDLAGQTSEASNDIKARIEDIQSSSNSSLSSIEEISKVISDVNDIVSTIATSVEEQSSATSEIAENMSQASSGIEEVNSNVNQSSTVAAEISKDISGVNQSSREIAERSDQVKQSAEDLSKLASRLDEMVGRFKI